MPFARFALAAQNFQEKIKKGMHEYKIESGEEEVLFEGLTEQNQASENVLNLLGLKFPELKLGDDEVDKKIIEMQ